MPSFIQQITAEILKKHGHELGKICIVFPSRRACAFMENHLSQSLATSSWSPDLLAIEDFVPRMHQRTVLDPVSLCFELFPIYHAAFPNESFDQFYAWGQLMIADFDEIDRHLVDGSKIFQNLHQLKTLDTSIDAWLNEDGRLSKHQEDYLLFWEKLGEFYHSLHENLKQQGLSSAGSALRELATSIAKEKPALPWRHIIFAGFNALSPAEELLFSSLMRHGLATCLWDYDNWYVDQEIQEAGLFFRRLKEKWEREMPEMKGKWTWVQDHLVSQPKTIVHTAVPKRVGQAKAAAGLLEALAANNPAESIALVLPDENMLFPVLHSLPPSLKDVNVTMGYPLRNTPLFGLVDTILGLQENAERLRPGSESEPVYYFRDILAILRHPYVQSIASEEGRAIIMEITQENMVYVSPKHFNKYEDGGLLKFLFQPWKNLDQAIEYLLELFQRLKQGFESRLGGEFGLPTVEAEILFQFHGLTKKLKEKLGKYLGDKDLQIFRRLYKEVIIAAGIPFAGEPLKGVQVMGMLETRVLDFDKIILLSANEGILPPKAQSNSLLPYGIRKAFGMPTFEEKDAIYAYHFYRLIQRASEVHLIYDSEGDSLGGGEKTRFAAQLEAELPRKNPQLQLEHRTFSFPTEPESMPAITVKKDDQLLQSLKEFASEKGFSPSALNSYINCSLQFYFRYLLRLKEKDQPEESMEDNTFGSVLHGVLEMLYEPFEGKTVQASDLEALEAQVEEKLAASFHNKTHGASYKTGRNRLLMGVIRDLVFQMLETDKAAAPFELLALEQELETILPIPAHPEGVKMRGFVDRIDRVKGQIRIIDYKTGSVGQLRLKNFLDLLEGRPQKEVFQLGSYAFLYMRNHPGHHQVFPGIYSMRNLPKGLLMLEYGSQRLGHFDQESQNEFEGVLANLLGNIFDLERPFEQTEDESRCRLCAYKGICNRS